MKIIFFKLKKFSSISFCKFSQIISSGFGAFFVKIDFEFTFFANNYEENYYKFYHNLLFY